MDMGLKMTETIKGKLKNALTWGKQPLCHGLADKITLSQSGGRTLRTLAEELDLYYFLAKSEINGRSDYKVFCKFKNHIECKHHMVNGKKLWYLTVHSDLIGKTFVSKDYHTRSNALKARKRTSNDKKVC